jgi:hypothetical protein
MIIRFDFTVEALLIRENTKDIVFVKLRLE